MPHLKNDILPLDDFWIGGTDEVLEGQWIWASKATPITYSNWYPGAPDSYEPRKENCLEIIKWANHIGEWNDDHCSDESHFICEME